MIQARDNQDSFVSNSLAAKVHTDGSCVRHETTTKLIETSDWFTDDINQNEKALDGKKAALLEKKSQIKKVGGLGGKKETVSFLNNIRTKYTHAVVLPLS